MSLAHAGIVITGIFSTGGTIMRADAAIAICGRVERIGDLTLDEIRRYPGDARLRLGRPSPPHPVGATGLHRRRALL